MKNLAIAILFITIFVGYTINILFLTTDKNYRDYQAINKVGVVVIPLGSIMGYVYLMDKNCKCGIK